MTAPPKRGFQHAYPTILRAVERSGLVEEIDRELDRRPGPRGQLSTVGLLTGMALLAHERAQGYQHEALVDLLCMLPEHWQIRLGVPTRPADSKKSHNRSRLPTLTYDMVEHKFHVVVGILERMFGEQLEAFTLRMLEASLPENVRRQRWRLIDGTFLPVWHKKRSFEDLKSDPDTDVSYYTRPKANGSSKYNNKVGYLLVAAHYFDPLDECVTPYTAYFSLAPANTAEPKVGSEVIRAMASHGQILDGVVVDGAFGQNPDFRAAVRDAHGDVIYRPNPNQQSAVRTLATGDLIWNGRVFAPNVDLDMLKVSVDGEQWFPTRPPIRASYRSNSSWLDAVEQWHRKWDELDRHAHKPLNLPGLNRTFRIDRRSSDLNALRPGANEPGPPTATIHAEDFPQGTWQPLPFGSRQWMHVHSAGRNRNEGAVADLRTIAGMESGQKRMRLRGLTNWKFAATMCMVTRNLQLQRALQRSRRSQSSKSRRAKTTRRAYAATGPHLKSLMRILKRRSQDRDRLEQQRASERQDRRAPPPDLPPRRRLP